ncbi:hypothetical protein D0B54_18065 [Solimonas sp. K1W22B-7]|uniref:hypothetical protein n=1 Tax=Solimonas sp. K1W22B-7 TaxID=2303331 RepID=UPI000E335439|nr:hypothetical protein [Solimonas sp. K1W22B-7]AXQ30465.1 hypothetical protein D0B54_18065 [Solimonas sp. K1W22B-7]
MKRRIALLALLLTGFASSSSAGEPESFANDRNTVCLEMEGEKFGLRIVAAGGAHEVLGSGALQQEKNLLSMEFSDSFENNVKGTFDPKSGILDLRSVKADMGSPSAAAASYGRYVLSRKKCTSNALE